MGGDDSQKLLPWRGSNSSPGRNLRLYDVINNVTETAVGILAVGLSYSPPGSFLESTGGSVLARAEEPDGHFNRAAGGQARSARCTLVIAATMSFRSPSVYFGPMISEAARS